MTFQPLGTAHMTGRSLLGGKQKEGVKKELDQVKLKHVNITRLKS